MIPKTFGQVRESTGKNLGKIVDYGPVLLLGLSIEEAFAAIPPTLPFEEVEFRSTHADLIPAYKRSASREGRYDTIRLKEGVPKVDLRTTRAYLENGRNVPAVFNTSVAIPNYEELKEFLPQLAERRVINYLDIIVKSLPHDREKGLSLHLNAADLEKKTGVDLRARVYNKKGIMPEESVHFVKKTFEIMYKLYGPGAFASQPDKKTEVLAHRN